MFLKNKYTYCVFLIILTVIAVLECHAQVDSSYIQPFPQDFSVRVYSFDKSAGFLKEEKDIEKEYRTNNPINIGLGVAWKNFSFSFSHGFNFFKRKNRGSTNSLEFQHHGYGRKFAYDIFIQRHKGFYEDEQNNSGGYNLYPDITLNMYGGSLQYIVNNKKFSYRAAFNQNERQLKSAGSLLLGTSIYYSKVQSNSTLLFDGMSKVHENLQFGLSVGYAFTWVFSKRWFATASITTGVTIGNDHPNRFFKERIKIYPTLNGRFALGYNADTWSIGTLFHINRVYLFYKKDESFSMNNSQLQITFIKRFSWGNKFVNETLNKTKTKLRL